MARVVLSGCRPEPVASYLKAVGVLRLVAEQADPEALGWWEEDVLVLESALSAEELVGFFLERYTPTPVLAPWNKDSGFYRRGTALDAIEQSSDPRLAQFREAIAEAQALLHELGWVSEPGKGKEKARFLAALRARLPDAALRWLDAVVALAGPDLAFAPLFAAGGVDGRLEFTRVYAECLLVALGIESARRNRRRLAGRAAGLRAALLGELEEGAAVTATGGLLLPESVDAPNAAPGFVGPKRVNPWDYVLALEGALLLGGAVARRFGAQRGQLRQRRARGRAGSSRVARRFGAQRGQLGAFPFTVEASSAGHARAGDEASRGELWLPLWHRPMGLLELTHLFREGRAEWRGRQAATATDMAGAIVSLGVDRGLSEFRRFGILGRSGKSHLAVPLGRWRVVERPEAQLLAEADDFLAGLRQAAGRREPPRALVDAVRRLEGAVLAYAAEGGRDRLTDLLLAVAGAELTLARRPGTRPRGYPRPVSGLSPAWVAACDDGSPELQLAAALASLRPDPQGVPGELRQHVEPVEPRGAGWAWSEEVPHSVVWASRDPLRDLAAVLERRLLESDQAGIEPALDGRVRARPAAVARFLSGELNLHRLARLAEAFALLDWGREAPPELSAAATPPQPVASLPSTYAVLKLTLLGRPIRIRRLEVEVRADATVLALLRAGDVWGATTRAARRLRAAGLAVRGIPREAVARPLVPDRELGHRLLAALLIPVRAEPLARAVLKLPEEQETTKEGAPS